MLRSHGAQFTTTILKMMTVCDSNGQSYNGDIMYKMQVQTGKTCLAVLV